MTEETCHVASHGRPPGGFEDWLAVAENPTTPRNELRSVLTALAHCYVEGDDRARFDRLVSELWNRGEKAILDEAEIDYCRVFGP